jgi:membrane protease YdiL (CAAX protease family)
MAGNKYSQLIVALVAAIIISQVALNLPQFLFENTITKMTTTQGLELFLSLLAILILGKGKFGDYGFRLPSRSHLATGAFALWMLGALALGALATASILLSGGMGNPVTKKLTFPQIILLVMISASVIEEVFTRGFLQSHLSGLADKTVKLVFIRVNLPTMISAVFFACMHLVLLRSGADLATVPIILIFTFLLGLMAGHQRAKSGSLIPAIVLHMLGNVGGIVGGIIYAIITYLTTGEMPKM